MYCRLRFRWPMSTATTYYPSVLLATVATVVVVGVHVVVVVVVVEVVIVAVLVVVVVIAVVVVVIVALVVERHNSLYPKSPKRPCRIATLIVNYTK